MLMFWSMYTREGTVVRKKRPTVTGPTNDAGSDATDIPNILRSTNEKVDTTYEQ